MAKTAAELKAELKKQGFRLPHGYSIVKRKPRAAKKVVKKTTPKKATQMAKRKMKRK